MVFIRPFWEVFINAFAYFDLFFDEDNAFPKTLPIPCHSRNCLAPVSFPRKRESILNGNGRMARLLVIYILEKNGHRLHPIKQIDYQETLRLCISKMNGEVRHANTFDDLYQTPVTLDFKNLILLHNMVPVVDAAMNPAVIKRSQHYSVGLNRKGGIDLTSDKALTVQNNGQGIKFYIDPAMLQQLQNAPGFYPDVISIEPLENLLQFLGIN